LEKYGVEYYNQLDEAKEEAKLRSRERYGTNTPLQSEEIKNKIKQTMLTRYGYSHPSKIPEIKEKKKQTSLQHWGTEYYLQSNIGKRALKKTQKQKRVIEQFRCLTTSKSTL
jgi:hypothetical protein